MERTPDEIKKGLEMGKTSCMEARDCYNTCSYCTECESMATVEMPIAIFSDALALIQQLERERDAAVKDIMSMGKGFRCHVCKKYFKNGGDCSGGIYCVPLRFEWRGVKEEDSLENA